MEPFIVFTTDVCVGSLQVAREGQVGEPPGISANGAIATCSVVTGKVSFQAVAS
jgi:hypothetical protein